MRLRSAKCTIGSGRRCTLRVRARGVQPLHCLIVRGAAGTVIRRWGPDTRLNGRTFADAELVAGDRLSIGPIDFEVLDRSQPPHAPPAKALEASEDRPKSGNRPAGRGPLKAMTTRLALANRQGRGRARRLLAELRSARQQMAELRQNQEEAEKQALRDADDARTANRAEARTGPAHPAEVAGHLAALESMRDDLDQNRRRWEAERAETERRLAQQARQIEARLAEFDGQRKAFQQDRDRWTAQRSGADQTLEARAEELDRHQAELDAERQALQRQRDQWNAEKAEAEKRLQEESEQLTAWSEQLETRQAELDAAANLDVQDRRPEAEDISVDSEADWRPTECEQPSEVQFAEPPDPSPLTSEEVFRQMGMPGSSIEPQPASPAPAEDQADPTPQADSAAEDDDSIDDYMARLLERVRQTADGSGKTSVLKPPRESQPEPPRAAPPAEPADPPPQPQTPPAKQAQSEDMSPRAVAPEKSVDLVAMRELANLSAHNAIDRHARRLLFSAATRKLLVAITGIVAGAALLWMRWTIAPYDLTLYGAGASLLVALLWGIQYAVLTGRMIVTKSGRLEWNQKRDDKPSTDTELARNAEPASEDVAQQPSGVGETERQ